jgi:hypothetical protein
MGDNLTKLDPEEEAKFLQDYADYSKNTGMNPNPNDPRHYYDYRGLWKDTGSLPAKGEHGDSKYKLEGHPRTYVNEQGEGSAVPKKGFTKTYAKGGKIRSASARADGIAIRGKTRA